MDLRADGSGSAAKNWFPIGMGIGALMLLCLAIGMYQVFVVGHHTLANTKEVPWNIFIVFYACAISSIGLSYIASFGIVLGIKQFDVIAKRATFLAILIIIAGILSVASDLKQPLHAPYLLLTSHMTSALGMVAISINLYLALIIAELYLLMKRGHNDSLVRVVAIASFITALVVHSYHGAIFGLAYSRSFWQGTYYPIYFLLSALFASSAIIILVTNLTYKVTGKQMTEKLKDSLRTIGKMLAYLLAIGMFFLYWKMTSTAYFYKPEAGILLSGSFRVNFWVFEVLIGYILPIIILFYARFKDINKMAFASLLVLIGLFVGRYDFIIVGQLNPYLGFVPFDSDLGGSAATLASYAPNLTEIVYTIGLTGIVWVGYILGIKYLPLSKDEDEEQ